MFWRVLIIATLLLNMNACIKIKRNVTQFTEGAILYSYSGIIPTDKYVEVDKIKLENCVINVSISYDSLTYNQLGGINIVPLTPYYYADYETKRINFVNVFSPWKYYFITVVIK